MLVRSNCAATIRARDPPPPGRPTLGDPMPRSTTLTAHSGLLPPEAATPRVRLSTLVNLRWLAIAGQTATVVGAATVLSLSFRLWPCLLIVAVAATVNVVTMLTHPATHRLGERRAFLMVLFDLGQLTALLFLTGGLNNPFALLFLAPVTISATTLSLRSTLTLGAVAVVMITLLAGYHVPLRTRTGVELGLPPLQLVGFWCAIVVGLVFQAGFAFRLTKETERMSQALLATQTALSREQKLHDLGGVVAATAHELGTPLATIKLVSSELVEELSDRPDLREDAALIHQQADRCRDILRSMGRAGKADRQIDVAPLPEIVREAAEPHAGRGIEIRYDFRAQGGTADRVPQMRRLPEAIHGLRNLIQNAVDFARVAIWVDVVWSEDAISIRVTDDGDGYPPEMLSRLGDPFLRSRNPSARPHYDGMGLGLFISKTLLERTGGTVTFGNGSRPGRARRATRGGAIAEVSWPRASVAVETQGGLGQNPPITS